MAFPVRDEFDLPADVAYLNCAYQGPLSNVTLAAGQAALARKARPWSFTVDDWFTPVQHYRELLAGLLGGDADGVAVTPSTSYGIATAAANVRVEPGEEIVILADQFPSNVYAWQALAERAEAWVHAVERPADGDWGRAVLEHLDRNGDLVAVVAVPACHWTDGTLVDLPAIGVRCRELGAALVVDVCQSLGAMPFSVQEVQPDFVAGALYKWLLGPYGVGFLWAAPERRNGTPLEHNWLNRVGSDDFSALTEHGDAGFRPGARRYDMGAAPNFALLPAANAALAQLAGWGTSAIAAYARTCTDRVAAETEPLGFAAAPPEHRAPHLIGIRRAGLDPVRIAAALAEDQVHVSIRGDAIRVSAHVFTTAADVDRLVAALARAVR